MLKALLSRKYHSSVMRYCGGLRPQTWWRQISLIHATSSCIQLNHCNTSFSQSPNIIGQFTPLSRSSLWLYWFFVLENMLYINSDYVVFNFKSSKTHTQLCAQFFCCFIKKQLVDYKSVKHKSSQYRKIIHFVKWRILFGILCHLINMVST